ncbi:hypothetical protein [Dinoroseobacter sp. S76]|uniref:hypothetical protein n=1 Tax=Dinoroseobacter sp. S76 TaxID=3415124 RepID=UPI003C7B82FC
MKHILDALFRRDKDSSLTVLADEKGRSALRKMKEYWSSEPQTEEAVSETDIAVLSMAALDNCVEQSWGSESVKEADLFAESMMQSLGVEAGLRGRDKSVVSGALHFSDTLKPSNENNQPSWWSQHFLQVACFAALIAIVTVPFLPGGGLKTLSNLFNPSTRTGDTTQLLEGLQRPDLIAAIMNGDHVYLQQNRTDVLLYLHSFTSALEEPQMAFVARSPSFPQDLQLSLSRELRMAVMTDEQFLRDMSQRGMAALGSGMAGLMLERRSQMNSGSFDPVSEILAFTSGMSRRNEEVALLRRSARFDAMRLVLMYEDNPDAFRQVYESILMHVRENL